MSALRPRLYVLILSTSLLVVAGCGNGNGVGLDGSVNADLGPDTDMDGVPDSVELMNGTNPNNPDSDDDGLTDGEEAARGTNPNLPDTDGDGLSDGDEVDLGTNPLEEDDACGNASSMSDLVRAPVDIIIVIDNSSSMDQEIEAVVNNVNTSFAEIIGDSGLDYRVILISAHGEAGTDPPGEADDLICITSPLSGTDCMPAPTLPANTERFRHFSQSVGSRNALVRITGTFDQPDEFNLAPNGWGEWLRPNAQRVILVVTDDNSDTTANSFRNDLFALPGQPFGTAEAPNFVFHSIIGVVAKSPDPTVAYQPNEPVVTERCSGAATPDARYQNLSIDSGGLRFPVCETLNYNAVFEAMAQGVIVGQEVRCTFSPPQAPMNTTLDFERVVVTYVPGAGANETLTRVENVAACVDGAFYVDDADNVELCPATCDRIKLDADATVELDVACTFDFG